MLLYVNIAQLLLSPKRLAQRRFPHDMINSVLDAETGESMEYLRLNKNPKYLQLYGQSYREELGRLSQGIPGQVKGTKTIFFIDKANVLANHWKDVTYGCVVVSY